MPRELRNVLEGLGLIQYLGAFQAQGFDSWETVLDITEADLYVPDPLPSGRVPTLIRSACLSSVRRGREALGVKLGHRRVSFPGAQAA